MTTPCRRWSFSLRTLFVVVTVACCWLGYQLHCIRRRADATVKYAASEVLFQDVGVYNEEKQDDRPSPAPWHYRILGDMGYMRIWVPPHFPDAEKRMLEELFPEATVLRYDYPDDKKA